MLRHLDVKLDMCDMVQSMWPVMMLLAVARYLFSIVNIWLRGLKFDVRVYKILQAAVASTLGRRSSLYSFDRLL